MDILSHPANMAWSLTHNPENLIPSCIPFYRGREKEICPRPHNQYVGFEPSPLSSEGLPDSGGEHLGEREISGGGGS
jgi:hypothetical protein